VSLPYVLLWFDPDLEPLAPREAEIGLSRLFERGQVSIRDGWDEHDSLVTVTCGRGIQGIWNQADEGSFTFYARGEAFAIDPGAHRGRSEDHNLVLIDGHGQGTEGGPRAVQGRIEYFEDRGEVVYVIADATEAYRSAQPMQRARRQLVFGRGPRPYLLVVDDIQRDDEAREYTWLLHTAAGNTVNIDGGRAEIVGRQRQAVMQVHFLWPQQGLEVDQVTSSEPRPNPILRARTTQAKGDFAVLMIARDADEPAPDVEFERAADRIEVRIRFAEGTIDRLVLDPANLRAVREN
jgi:hypothetical protein